MEEENQPLSKEQELESILHDLENIRDMLTEVNIQFGYLSRYCAIRDEIEETGWGGICAKYHPDINVNEPAAMELFELYRYVYDMMQRD
jgi:hypothetical protein